MQALTMGDVIQSSATLWSDEYEQRVIAVLKRAKTGNTLKREDYHILSTFQVVSFGGIEHVKKMMGTSSWI